MSDVVESPISKQKFKQISREIKISEKTGSYKAVVTNAMQKMVGMKIP